MFPCDREIYGVKVCVRERNKRKENKVEAKLKNF